MKRRLIIFILILILLPEALAVVNSCIEVPTKDWFILAGQSNMVGNSLQTTPIAYGDEAWRNNSGIIYRRSPLYDAVVFYNTSSQVDGHGAWPSFAYNYSLNDVALLAAASGNTCLVTNLNGTTNEGAWDPDTGAKYQQMLGLWIAAGSPELKAVAWMQGECESTFWHAEKLLVGQTDEWQYNNSYDQYKPALKNLADNIWADFGVPLVVAPISLQECDWDNSNCSIPDAPSQKAEGVHNATIDAASEHAHIILGPDTDDLRIGENGHIYDVNTLGERWAASMEALP